MRGGGGRVGRSFLEDYLHGLAALVLFFFFFFPGFSWRYRTARLTALPLCLLRAGRIMTLY